MSHRSLLTRRSFIAGVGASLAAAALPPSPLPSLPTTVHEGFSHRLSESRQYA
ncbi:twin-arginine translocation signal domain-containing protein [Paraburkholderia sp. DD10]|uniref:twin-arginine translocation signal domain-containing protein n=1 Tax=Paraburkholderia sp. DD10 TaxID=3409691 RepID=UPI003B9FD23B